MIANRVIGCVRCGKPSALTGEEIPGDGLCRWCRHDSCKATIDRADARPEPNRTTRIDRRG